MTRIAFIGLGAMGSRMAHRLLGDFELTVHNRTRARAASLLGAGARWADSPRDAAAGADVVISVVTDDEAAASVWLDARQGAVHGLREGALALECSTVTPAWIQRLGAAVGARGARLLDAPVVGSTPQAEAGQLAFLVGGAAADVAAAGPAMARMGAKVQHVGPQTHGAVLKLAVNALFAAQVAMLAEWLRALPAQGLDPARAADLLGALPITSPAGAAAAGAMLAGAHTPGFPVALVAKDLRYASGLGALPLTAAVGARFEAAAAAGLGGHHLTALHALSP